MGRARGSLRRPVGAHLGAKMGQVGAKMALSWPTSRQDVAKMAHMEPKMGILSALLGGSWRLFLDLGGDLAKTSENPKNENSSSLLLGFRGSWGGLLEAMLAHLGAMLGYVGPSWRQVGPSWPILSSSCDLLGKMFRQRCRR